LFLRKLLIDENAYNFGGAGLPPKNHFYISTFYVENQ
jgi:hypothetical protein